MSTTKALLVNLTEIPVINTCYCFQILTNFIVLAKKITSQPGIDCISRHIVTEGACNEFSGAMLKRGRYVVYKHIISYTLHTIPYTQTGLNKIDTAINSSTGLYMAKRSYSV